MEQAVTTARMRPPRGGPDVDLEIGSGNGPFCVYCGIDLSLSESQIGWVMEYGNPIPRPPCKDGHTYHRVDGL